MKIVNVEYHVSRLDQKCWSHLKESGLKIINDNKDLINQDKYSPQDIKFKHGFLIAPDGRNVLVHNWNGKFYYKYTAGEDWEIAVNDNKEVDSIDELTKLFCEDLTLPIVTYASIMDLFRYHGHPLYNT